MLLSKYAGSMKLLITACWSVIVATFIVPTPKRYQNKTVTGYLQTHRKHILR